jgi:AmmeMemoRadiSam system protein B/AmmeMemoRadiSam system protein A
MEKRFFLSILIVLISLAVPGRGSAEGRIRKPVVAGMFYPSDPHELRRVIQGCMGSVEKVRINGKIVGLISPHAGYMYSGQVAACAYTLLEGMDFEDVIVIGPSHRIDFVGASIYDGEGYETPLGIVPIDGELSRKIGQQSKIVQYLPQAHAHEHSLEVQIPFLQSVLGRFSFVPMVMGPSWNVDVCRQLSQAVLQSVRGRKALIVASSDLTHSYNYRQVVAQDELLARHVDQFDIEGLAEDLRRGRCQACGGGPMVVSMMVAQGMGAERAKVLKLTNSADITGMKSPGNYVVGYMAAALLQGVEKSAGGLTGREKQLLHQIARRAIENTLRKGHTSGPEPIIDSRALQEKRGAFVTLKEHGRLRGCIGYIEGIKPLYKAVEEMAIAAAFHDPRFTPVSEAELPHLEIEISVLTPVRQVKGIEEIEVGKHGIIVQRGSRSGLLLPQVATEYGWDRRTFLEHTCLKAGLPTDAWKEAETRIYVFSAEVF